MEFKRLRTEEDSFELKGIEPGQEGVMDNFIETYITKEKINGKMIECQKWTMTRNGNKEGVYKVKIYHINNDEFKGKIYP